MSGAPTTNAISFPFAHPPKAGKAVEIADRLLWMRLPLPMALDHINVYAFRDTDGWTVVDTGIGSKTTRALWDNLIAGPLSGAPIVRVLITHHHPDHIGNAGWFQSEGAELLTSRTAWLFARMLTLDVQDRPLPETLAYWRASGMPADMLANRANERPFNFADCVTPMPLGFTRLAKGDTLEFGGRNWTVRLGQGHAPDHLVLFSDDGEFVLAGDHYLPTISPNLGVYATEPTANPVADWLDSHRALAPYLDDTQVALPGHGLPFQGLPFRSKQLIDNHVSALERVEYFLAEPKTAVDCFKTIFKRDIGPGEYTLALVEAMAHCLALWHAGRVTRHVMDDGRWLFEAKETSDAQGQGSPYRPR
ncbi:MAG: MBL fold metallo-hydrolase [Pseudomonadota bacterium]